MSKKTIFEEAVADAKAVKKTALELAKQTLEEHFAPKLNSMIDKKLQESLDEEYSEDDSDEDIEEKAEEKPKSSEEKKSEEMDEDSINLEELLKELESEEGGSEEEKSEIEEAYGSSEEAGKKGVKPMDEKKSEEESDEDEEGKEDLDERAEYLRLKEKFEGKKASSEDKKSEEGEEEKEFDVDEEFDVEALLKELEGSSSEEEKKSEVDEAYGSSEEAGKKGVKPMDEKKEEKSELEKMKSELHEMRTMMKDVNLANSKLLYFNKIVKENENLSKGDKANILKQIDKCTDVKQTKLVYETVVSALKSKTKTNNNKKAINESVASKPVGTSTGKKSSDEDNAMYKRFQELAFGKRF